MKRFLTLILTAILFSFSISAQGTNETVLVNGNPPLTQTMVEQMQLFFEWVLDKKFNQSQNQKLKKLLIEEWKSGNKSDITDALKLMAIPGALEKFSAKDQKLIHDKFQLALLEQIQKQPENALSELLSEVQKNNDILNQPSNGTISQKANFNPANFAGEWLYRISGSIITYTNNAGGYADPSGELSGYKLHSDGTYEHGYLLSSSLYGCNTKIFGYETGTWTVEGNRMIFQDKTASLTSKDSCNASGNYQKKLPLNHYYYDFRLERDEYGLKLAFLKTDGSADPYYKQETGKMGW
ncbi:MAG: hypothetical protein K1X72_05295 [Pyrinomonadaceae bacterium]|nr:hypothetical protein [Pyrinomonadaceae bacterium]